MSQTYGRLPASALVNGHFPSGSGGSIDHFAQQQADGALIAMSVIHRQGADYPIDDVNGENTYFVNSGSQPGNPNRAEWNFNFDVSTGPKETLQQFLVHDDIKLIFHQEGTSHASDTVLHAVFDPAHATGSSPVVFEDAQNHIVIADNGGNSHILANSENVHFGFLKPAYNFGNATFDIDLQIIQKEILIPPGGTIDHTRVYPAQVHADIHDVIIVGSPIPPPEHF